MLVTILVLSAPNVYFEKCLLDSFVQDYEGRHHAGVQGGRAKGVTAHDRQHGQDQDQQDQGRSYARGRSQVDQGQDPGLGSHEDLINSITQSLYIVL